MTVQGRFVIVEPPHLHLAREGISAYPLFLIDLSTEKTLPCAGNLITDSNLDPDLRETKRMNEPATTILVIDDEQPFCEVVAEILTTFGYPVRKAFNAAQALKVLESITPILIILDIMMPDVDGLTLVRKFRTDPRLSKIPVIMSSAKFLKEDRAEAFNAGASAYLTKPFSAAELRSAIVELLGEKEPQLTLNNTPGYIRQ